ncbi:hypothetical protein [Paraburkholderia diazotrophica]|nr:hypothetical protein [Paraburkholderia diazotrophica]
MILERDHARDQDPADEARLVEHLVKLNAPFVSYLFEVAHSVRLPAPNP